MPGRALVVTYYFPPVGGVGVQRTLKYVKYLRRWGWQPVVLAPRDPGYQLRDESLLGEIPEDVEVHRTLSLEPSRVVAKASRRVGMGEGRSGPAAAGGPAATAGPAAAAGPAAGRVESAAAAVPDAAGSTPFKGRLLDGLRTGARVWTRTWDSVLFPDETVAWMPSAVVAGAVATRREHIDVLYSTAPPMGPHLIAATLKRLTGKPWVADFRDPWVGNPFAAKPGAVRDRAERRTERLIVEQADRVVLAMETLRLQFAERYPEHAAKFVFIPNGYDRADVPALAPRNPDPECFRILFAGSLYRPNELDVFLTGVERLLDRRPDLATRLRIDFVGRVNERNARIAADFLRRGRLGEVVTFTDFLPRPEALARMAGADALLQLMAAEEGAGMFVGGKLLEYLAMDRPILAVMPPGEGRRLVESLPGGRTADVEPGSIASALERLVDDPPAPGPSDPEGRYDRINLARELAGVLDGVVRRP